MGNACSYDSDYIAAFQFCLRDSLGMPRQFFMHEKSISGFVLILVRPGGKFTKTYVNPIEQIKTVSVAVLCERAQAFFTNLKDSINGKRLLKDRFGGT